MEHVREADGTGQLDVKGKLSDTPYHLKVLKNDQSYRVEISVTAPRDWLLQRGFDQEATLVSEGGRRIPLHSDSQVDVTDNVSIILTSEPDLIASQQEMQARYPELGS